MLHLLLSYFFVWWYRAELVGPKCSNVMLIKARAAASPWTRQSAVVPAEKVVKQVCFTQVPDHQHGQCIGVGAAL